ncbi:NTP transferase domain-containing protein [Biomphalaria pfeifferi]|uniref:NTP transferase domain-containing protein n=1 Tax=Biomphalaria pfeifferi TaxID=112525 RepID=A0AAD8ESZ1_BIOPF|nr:NTP transferase domain-containing protein [Biomphalaria pfeifferi]
MMPVCGKPFLSWLVENLIKLKISVFLSSGKHTTDIHQYFGESYWEDFNVRILIENMPLGTGGAIRFCADSISTKSFIVLNADTVLSNLRLKDAVAFHNSNQFSVTQVLSVASNQNAGKIIVEDNLVAETFENSASENQANPENSFSSTGVYIFEREFVIDNFPIEKSSLEIDLLPEFIKARSVGAWIDSTTVTDFGTPDRYGALNFTETQLRNMFQ